jgi:phosphoglycerate-specific signal transduction histidine kinase
MANKLIETIKDIYQDNSKFKWVVLTISVLISISSIYYTNILVNQLKERERAQVRLFAKAIQYISTENDNAILFVLEEIINKNNSVPTILVDGRDAITVSRNVDVDSSKSAADIEKQLRQEIEIMMDTYEPIIIPLIDPSTGEQFETQKIYYRNSFLLRQLIAYPYIQLTVIAIFAFISYLAFNYSKTAEQNRVWVGLAKETAHQLGTPLSSLMAWIEVLRDDPEISKRGIADELDKDVRKLRVVTERFSSIGSTPTLRIENINVVIQNVINYLQPRISSKIKFEIYTLSDNIMVNIHAPLFEWVLENLFKNAVDAIGSAGTISVKILRGSGNKVFIDISDTGKGIPASILPSVFKPGFTTKKRGWGLGLALAKRIIELYHYGRIFVKSSDENHGTTFRIELKST